MENRAWNFKKLHTISTNTNSKCRTAQILCKIKHFCILINIFANLPDLAAKLFFICGPWTADYSQPKKSGAIKIKHSQLSHNVNNSEKVKPKIK